MDLISIKQLAIHTIVGVYPHEKLKKCTVYADLEIAFDCRLAGKSDDLAHALDYDFLTDALKKNIEQQSFNLIETLAEQTAQFILNFDNVINVKVTIDKPHALSRAKNVSVTIARTPKDYIADATLKDLSMSYQNPP